MSDLTKLISWIDKTNIAEDIQKEEGGEQTLRDLASRVIDNYERDKDSMTDWSNDISDGETIAKQETNSKSEPWEGAANFKSPAIISASVAFGDRATTELLRGKDILKIEIIGSDPQQTKKKASENIGTFMNWQINHQMTDWRDKQETVYYAVPSFGSVFKKIFYDPIEGINKSEVLHYPDFAVNQGCQSMEECKSFSCLMDISKNETIEKQTAGIWLDVEIYAENEDGDTGSDEEQEVTKTEDNAEKFIEQSCFFDLDGDGYEEPYIVTVHERTSQVVRIVARFDDTSIFIQQGDQKVVNLHELKKRAIAEQALLDINNAELVRISPEQNIVKYDFIKSIDGTFLGIGYYHLLSALSKGINVTTNQLLDSATLSNLQGGFLAKGFRKRMGNMKMKAGSWISTDISANDLQSGILPHQFKEPSATLFSLNERLNKDAKEFSVNVDLQGVLSPNAPATTTLALIQEAMMPNSAIMRRIIRAQSKEFVMLYILDSKFTDPALYQQILDDEGANYESDFNLDSMDISPTANPEMSSRMQRIQRAEILVSQTQNIAMEGGDTRPIWNNWFDEMGAEELIDQVFPDPETVSEEQAKRLEAKQAEQRKKDQLLMIEIDHAERRVKNEELKTTSEASESRATILEKLANLSKIESETILNLEKAETEDNKNNISRYTAQLDSVRLAIDAEQKVIDFETKERDREDDRKLSEQNAGAAQS